MKRSAENPKGPRPKCRRLDHSSDTQADSSSATSVVSRGSVYQNILEYLSSDEKDVSSDEEQVGLFNPEFTYEEESDEELVYTSSTPGPSGVNVQPFCPLPVPNPSTVSSPTITWNTLDPNVPEIPFTSNRSLKIHPAERTPYNVFRLLLTDNFIDSIVEQTNIYGEYLASQRVTPSNTQWKVTTRNEILVFIGLTLHTGTFKLPRLKDYWSSKERRHGILHVGCFGQIMSRDRYFTLLKALHFARNPGPDDLPPTDILYKIRPFIEHFHTAMDTVYSPDRELCIDESMVLWRGRLAFRQYIQNKKHRYGMKLYVLAEPNGLALKFLLYAGPSDLELGGAGHTDKVVKNLLEGRTGLGHSLYMDNFYNSVPLTKFLIDEKTYVTGPLRKTRRHSPHQVLNHHLGHNEMVQRFTNDGICVMKWRGRREVLMISSEFSGDMVDVTNRRGQTTPQPLMVNKYNTNMSVVDRMDQLLAYYPMERNCLKWYRKLAIHVIHMMLNNAQVLYNSAGLTRQDKLSSYNFRLDVIETLTLLPYDNRPGQIFSPTSFPYGHFPKSTEQGAGASRGIRLRRLRCRQCKKNQATTCFCDTCPADRYGEIGLCINCFRPYHEAL